MSDTLVGTGHNLNSQAAYDSQAAGDGMDAKTGSLSPHRVVARDIFCFNRDWQFYLPCRDDGASDREITAGQDNYEWSQINLPHTVRLEPLNASGGRNYQGICYYRKSFHLDNKWADKVLYLKFQGAMQVADIWINGRHVMKHEGGYLPFTIDITQEAIFDGANLLSIVLDNSDNPNVPPGKPQDALDFTYFGGLSRSVTLEVLDPLHISDPCLANRVAGGGLFVSYPKVSDEVATVQVCTDLINKSNTSRNCVVRQSLVYQDKYVGALASESMDLKPGQAKAITQSLEIHQPNLWHPDSPHLYELQTEVVEDGQVVDQAHTKIGIRSIRFDNSSGLYINGSRFVSVGANRHQDHPYVGYALPESAHYGDAKKLRDAGFTSVRSHYPQDPAFMDACDELGILVIVSNPGWQFMGDDRFKRRVIENARRMVRRDRNHASAMLWEAALNEIDNAPIATDLYRAVHEEYPGDQCYVAGDHISPFDDFPGWDVEFWENDGTRPQWIREWGDQVDNWSDQQSSSRVPRSWGEMPMLVQAWAHLTRLNDLWKDNDGPAGLGKGRLCGAGLWAGIDCYRGYHVQPFYGGPLDLFRLPKFSYFMFQSQQSPYLRSTVSEAGPMVYIANFATFLSPSTVTVFSNCDEVRLWQNGVLVASQKPDTGYRIPHPPFSFTIGQFTPERSMMFSTGVAEPGVEIGELYAEGILDGQIVATYKVQAPGVQSCLELSATLDRHNLVADGSDWLRIYARVCDARGTTHPFADDLITFTVTGEGSIIGDASIGANPVRAEAGIATVLVRATTRPGPIIVRASAFGLTSSEIEVNSVQDEQPFWPKSASDTID